MIFNYSFDYKHNYSKPVDQPVAVIVNFSVDGRFIPIYFRYVAGDCSESTYKIDGIKYFKDKNDRILFCCLVTSGGIRQQIFLTFYIRDCIWRLDV